MEWVKTTAKTLPEAIDLALDNLGVDEAEAEIVVLEEPRPGLFGRLRGTARVEARVKPKPIRPKNDRNRNRNRNRNRSEGRGKGGRNNDRNRSRNRNKNRGDDQHRSESGQADEKRSRDRDQDREKAKGGRSRNDRGGRNDGDRGNDRGDRNDGGNRSRRSQKGKGSQREKNQDDGGNGQNSGRRPEADDQNRSSKSRNGSGKSGRGGDRSRENRREEQQVEESSVEEVATHLEQFLSGLTEAFGFDGGVVVDNSEDEVLVGQVEGQHGLMVGPKGRTLDAVQELARITCQRSAPSSIRIKVDVGGYREQRAAALASFAEKAAEKAVAEQVEVALDPMSAADRKSVHDALNADDRVETRSIGNDPRRRVLVVPVSADEEEADDETLADDESDESEVDAESNGAVAESDEAVPAE